MPAGSTLRRRLGQAIHRRPKLERFLDRLLRPAERAAKVPLFGCRMCGQCVLHSTGMVCPMTCPKNLRNGPCGGVRRDGSCEVYPDQPCVWVNAYEQSQRLLWPAEIHDLRPPVDWALEGSSSWLNWLTGRDRVSSGCDGQPASALEILGSSQASARPAINPPSRLAAVLSSGGFAVAAELSPPRGVDVEAIVRDAAVLKDYVDAVNVTDNQAASVRMASLPVCALLVQQGVEPVVQFTCRDRNRLAIQADLLGAAALGIHNVLCLSGDHVRVGDHPMARNVNDLDSTHLIRLARNMTERGCLDNGREIAPAPRFFVGAVANPFAPPEAYRPYRLAKKAAAGASFIQTQLIYNPDRFRAFMAQVVDLGLAEKVYILAGVGPFKSARQASYMATKVAGMEVPQALIDRMEKTPKAAQAEEGLHICCEIIEQVREIPGVAGVHIMAVHWAEAVPEIVTRVGLFPRPPVAVL